MAGALAAALLASLLAVSGVGGSGAATPRVGGTVTVGAFEPPCLNVLVSPCKDLLLPISATLRGALEIGPDHSWRPRLVSHVNFTTKPPFTLTYHIRSEARWSDGVPVTARDFVFTYQARLKYPQVPEDDPYKTRILRLRAVDAKTVQVVLRSRFAFWRNLFDVVLPQHALRGENLERVWLDRIDNPKTGVPIGSGPFLVQGWERGKQLTFVRNPRYWGPRPAYLDRIVIRFVPALASAEASAAIAALFRSREADVGGFPFTEELASELRRIPGLGLRFLPGSGWEHLDIRIGTGGHPALKEKLVRRALAHGFDRIGLVRALLGGYYPNARPLDSVVSATNGRFYKPNWGIYRYQPAEARDLLERAGCRTGADGIYVCAGKRLSLRFVSRGALARRVQTIELVRAQLRQVGVEVIASYAAGAAHNQTIESGNFDVTLFGWFSTDMSAGVNELYGCGGDLNYVGYCQRLVTRDLNQANLILDADKRARVLNRADAQIASDVPVIPLYEVPIVVPVRTTVRGYVPHFPDATWNAEDWWRER